MIKFSMVKFKWIIICAVGFFLTACIGSNKFDDTQRQELSPLKQPASKESQQLQPPVANPNRKRRPEPATNFQRQMLAAVNAARVAGYTCGNRKMPAVAAVVWNNQLQQAALLHSQNMAAGDYFNHKDQAGNRVGERVYAVGYNWRAAGENIAAGQLEAEVVINGWLGSRGHCLNIMDGDFSQMGMASYTNKNTYYGIYWTQVLAAPF